MKVRDLIDVLIQIELETSLDEEILVDVKDVPGLDVLYGCHIEGMARDSDDQWAIQSVAP